MPLRRKKFILALQPHEVSPNRTDRSPWHQTLAFCSALLVLMGLAFPLACGNLATDSTMNESLQINDSTCFTVTAANVTLDCAGFNIIGNNSSATYGIHSDNQFNTTIKNCNISNFATGIFFEKSDNGTIQNTTTYTTAAYSAPSGQGIYIYNGAKYNTVINSSGYSLAGRGIMLYSSCDHNTISNSTGTAGGFGGIYIYGSSNNTITNSQITGKHNTYGALFIYTNGTNNTIANSTINGWAATRAVTLQGGSSTGNRLINNTILNATNLLWLDAGASGNTFTANTFANVTGNQIQDTGHDNQYSGNTHSQTMGTAINITGANNTIDCLGGSITGNNTTSTYGIYSNQLNTTIRNCNISNFGTGIYIDTTRNATIQNTSTHTTKDYSTPTGIGIYLYRTNHSIVDNSSGYSLAGRGIIAYMNASHNTISNCNGTTGSLGGIYLSVDSSNNTIINSTGTSGTYGGIFIYQRSENNTVINSMGTSGTYGGIYVFTNASGNTIINSTGVSTTYGGIFIREYSHNNTVTGSNGTAGSNGGIYIYGSSNNNVVSSSQITGDSDSIGALSLYQNVSNNTVANCTVDGMGAEKAATIQSLTNTGNLLINNTFLNATDLLWIHSTSSNNTVCWNNFTDVSGYYINDTNGSNFYNGSACGGEGNIYHNVINGSVSISGIANSTIEGLSVGVLGTGFPYTSATSEGKFACAATGCGDFAPLTPSLVSCITTLAWQAGMTPDGMIITRYTDLETTWLAQFVEANQTATGCINSVTAYGSTRNGTVFGTLTTNSTGNLTMNHTNVPVNNTINLWSVAFLYNGTNITLASREYYVIGMPRWIGENMLGEILILAGVALIYIAFRKEKEGA